MYEVKASSFSGKIIDLGPAEFPSLDLARGFAIAAARWMQAVSQSDGQIEITSNDDQIEGAVFAYWAQREFSEGGH